MRRSAHTGGIKNGMKYFLYLRRLFSRAWREQLLLLFLLTTVVMLPLCMMILESSRVYGAEFENMLYTKGNGIIIHYAEPGDEEIFSDVPGAIAVWDDGVLYVDRTADNPWNEAEERPTAFHTDVREAFTASERRWFLRMENVEDMRSDSSKMRFPPVLYVVLFSFTTFLLLRAYSLYWKQKREDMDGLRSIGAERRQISRIFCAHFLLMHTAASLLALGLSAILLYGIIEVFLAHTANDQLVLKSGYRTLQFHVEWDRLAVALTVLFLFAFLYMLLYFAVTGIGRRKKARYSRMWRKPMRRADTLPFPYFSALWNDAADQHGLLRRDLSVRRNFSFAVAPIRGCL